MKFSSRFYREFTADERFVCFRVKVDTTDLFVRAGCDLSAECEALVRKFRKEILAHIDIQPEFLHSYSPVERIDSVPEIISAMYDASARVGVGPMAAVAGAVAEFTGRALLEFSPEIIIENGGDNWMNPGHDARVGIYTENSKFSGRVVLDIAAADMPCGICTSSGRIGPSFSFGRADSATIIAPCCAFADALATAAGNMVMRDEDAAAAAEKAVELGAHGAVIIINDTLAAAGNVRFAEL